MGKLFAAINYPGQTPHIVALDVASGTVDRLQHIRGGALFYVSSLAYDKASKKLFYTTDNNHERDLNVLDVVNGHSQMLIQNFRTGDLAFNRADSSLWGVRHLNGLSTIVRLAHPYGDGDWEEMFVWDYGKDVFDLDVSPDGRLLTAALAELNGRQLLIAMNTEDLRQGKTGYDVLFDDASHHSRVVPRGRGAASGRAANGRRVRDRASDRSPAARRDGRGERRDCRWRSSRSGGRHALALVARPASVRCVAPGSPRARPHQRCAWYLGYRWIFSTE